MSENRVFPMLFEDSTINSINVLKTQNIKFRFLERWRDLVLHHPYSRPISNTLSSGLPSSDVVL
jgi:hypothetical protein